MHIITSKTDEAISNTFSRRGFLKLAGPAGFGVIIYSEFGSHSLAVGTPAIAQQFGWKNFFGYFSQFALDLGMNYLGNRMSQWLPRYPLMQTAVNSFLNGLGGNYSLYNDHTMIGGYGTTFFPMYQAGNGWTMSPFFGLNNQRLGSGIALFTGLGLPQVSELMDRKDGYGDEERVRYLIPREAQKKSNNNFLLPERYGTDAGSAEFRYKGDEKGGDINFKIWAKEYGGTLEQEHRKGTLEVQFNSFDK